jgi:hypothetical protein
MFFTSTVTIVTPAPHMAYMETEIPLTAVPVGRVEGKFIVLRKDEHVTAGKFGTMQANPGILFALSLTS